MPLAERPYDEWWFEPHLADGWCSYVYVVAWPQFAIVKVGVTDSPRRWRKFCRRGGRLLALVRAGVDVERQLEAVCASRGERAFFCKEEAVPLLGSGGGGYTECYYINWDGLNAVLDTAEEVERALVQG